ncbi:MAG: hypothetical protein KDK39_19295 [Leptospiraceae bacterium]|nr:hypothetical protein [Leptospiraceae bacterium]
MRRLGRYQQKMDGRLRGLSLLRLISFGTTAALVYLSGRLPSGSAGFYTLLTTSAVTTAGFIWAWFYYNKTRSRKQMAANQINWYQSILYRRSGIWHKTRASKSANQSDYSFEQSKQQMPLHDETNLADHPYQSDLHISGHFGLISLLDCTITAPGKETLARLLLEQPDDTARDPALWLARQQAVDEWRCRRVIHTRWARQKNQHEIFSNQSDSLTTARCLSDLKPGLGLGPAWLIGISFTLLNLVTWVSVIGSEFGDFRAWYLLSAPLQMLLFGFTAWSTRKLAGQMSRLAFTISLWPQAFQLIPALRLRAAWWQNKAILQTSTARQIANLARLAGFFEMRRNPLLYIFLAFFGITDSLLVIGLYRWLRLHSADFPLWLSDLAELDALQSLASLAVIERGNTCLPVWARTDGNSERPLQPVVVTHDMGHPLIPAAQRVGNDFHNVGELWVISGSNMAGKSTFLRTLGINLILAMSGAALPAADFSFRSMPVFSSMQHTDKLQDSRSLFYSEVRRIRQLLEFRAQQDGLILIDEMLRGTNARERLIAQQKILARLESSESIVLVATHDLELGCSSTGEKRVNMHFREHIENGRMSFDYKLYPGIVQSSNALEILRLEGIAL